MSEQGLDTGIVARKGFEQAAVVIVAAIVGRVLAPRLEEYGVQIDVQIVAVSITAAVAGALASARNWLKHRRK